MSASLEKQIEADCSVLLIRALLGRNVAAFGEDGLGKYGTSSLAQFFTIEDIDLDVVIDQNDDIVGAVSLKLAKYKSSQVGHICTDLNFMISVKKLLADHHIDPACVQYSDLCLHGEDYVSLDIDVERLLDWA